MSIIRWYKNKTAKAQRSQRNTQKKTSRTLRLRGEKKINRKGVRNHIVEKTYTNKCFM